MPGAALNDAVIPFNPNRMRGAPPVVGLCHDPGPARRELAPDPGAENDVRGDCALRRHGVPSVEISDSAGGREDE